MKKPQKLPPVIPAPPELVEKMQYFSTKRGITFAQAKAQVDAQLRTRNDSIASSAVVRISAGCGARMASRWSMRGPTISSSRPSA